MDSPPEAAGNDEGGRFFEMRSSRRQGREAALQMLYLVDSCDLAVDKIPNAVLADEPLSEKTLEFARHLASGTVSQWERIDKLVTRHAKNWEMRRMAAVDRCLLRLASFELLMDLETPVNVIINEAVELAKKYSTAESSKFVNGILDKIKEERKHG
jgi:N utilization substance protein B